MYILGVIPARGNSQGIKDKNIYPLLGRPLIEYTIEAAENSHLSDYVVFTDKYTQYIRHGIERPKQYSEGEYNSVAKWMPYLISEYEQIRRGRVDAVCLLQPTSPLRTTDDIDKAIRLYRQTYSTSLYSGYELKIKHKDKVFDKSINKPHFQRNGAIFITDKKMIMDEGKLWDDYVFEMEMPYSRSIDIDTKEDMFMAEALLRHGVKGVFA
jgi:CMP-N,N'-diacetyllegionaminic acid synthase